MNGINDDREQYGSGEKQDQDTPAIEVIHEEELDTWRCSDRPATKIEVFPKTLLLFNHGINCEFC